MSLVLPTQLVPATKFNPKRVVIYGQAKIGKSSALAQLKNNLIIDTEGGTEYMDAMAVQARTVEDLGTIAQAIREKNEECGHNFYKFITIDTATKLEDICLPWAAKLYKSKIDPKWTGTDVRDIGFGAGYRVLYDCINRILAMFENLCDTFIITCHTYEDVDGKSDAIQRTSLSLPKQTRKEVERFYDCIGYCYRKGKETHLSFVGGDNYMKGTRIEHLRDKDFIIGEWDEENNKLLTHWDQIFK